MEIDSTASDEISALMADLNTRVDCRIILGSLIVAMENQICAMKAAGLCSDADAAVFFAESLQRIAADTRSAPWIQTAVPSKTVN